MGGRKGGQTVQGQSLRGATKDLAVSLQITMYFPFPGCELLRVHSGADPSSPQVAFNY